MKEEIDYSPEAADPIVVGVPPKGEEEDDQMAPATAELEAKIAGLDLEDVGQWIEDLGDSGDEGLPSGVFVQRFRSKAEEGHYVD